MHELLKKKFLPISLAALVLILFSALFLFFSSLARDTQLRIHFLNVSQGDAILIETPHGRKVLVDAGPDESVISQLDSLLPLSEREIDIAIATHPDLDHVGGFLSLVNTYPIKRFFHSGLTVAEPEYAALARKLSEEGIPAEVLKLGDRVDLGDGVSLLVLSPARVEEVNDANEASLVLILDYRGKRILLTGDAPQDVERKLVHAFGDGLRADVLKLGHHGSKTSSSELFLETVHPRYAIISAGCRNRFGHPHPEVMGRLRKIKIQDFQTCFDGTISFRLQNGRWELVP